MIKSKVAYAKEYILKCLALKSVDDLESARIKIQEYQEEFEVAQDDYSEDPNANDYGIVCSMNDLIYDVIQVAEEEKDVSISRNTVVRGLEELLSVKNSVIKKGRWEEVPYQVFNLENSTNAYYIYLQVSDNAVKMQDVDEYKQLATSIDSALDLVKMLFEKAARDEISDYDSYKFNYLCDIYYKLNNIFLKTKKLETKILGEETDYEPKA